MSEGHAILPCSSGKQWGNCDAWLRMNEATPEPPETDEALWGTACHELASEWLATGVQPPCDDAEMVETAELYVQHCQALMAKCGDASPGIELRVKTNIDHVWGTLDFKCYDPAKRFLFLRDLKTGRLLVDPDDEQLILYANGLINTLGLDDQELVLDLGVVQPRGYHREGPIRYIRMYATDIRAKCNQLRIRAERNLTRDGEAQAGAHCYNCNARTRCSAAVATAQAMPYLVSTGLPTELQPAEAGLLLKQTKRAIKFLEQMGKAYAGEVEGHLSAGKLVPGWGVAPSYARSKDWTVPDEQVILLGELYGVDLRKPGLKTPTQAQNAKIPEEVINEYCTRRQTGVKLTESDDKQIANIFQGIK